jgi:hypothetical protein
MINYTATGGAYRRLLTYENNSFQTTFSVACGLFPLAPFVALSDFIDLHEGAVVVIVW